MAKRRIQYYSSVLLTLLFLVGCAEDKTTAIEDLPLPHLYVANTTSEAPVIDGTIDAVWDQAAWSKPFIDIEGIVVPKYATQFKMLWDDTALYLLAELQEPHIWGNLKQRDTIVFYNNDFEIFIDPNGDTHNYMEIEVNALNTVWDLFLKRPYRNGVRAETVWDIEGLQTAVHHIGTLNDPSDTDERWLIEMALPWQSLSRDNRSGKIPVDSFWRMNFSRVHWEHDLVNGRYERKKDAEGKFLRESNWVWSPQGVVNMHEPEHWGYVYFATENKKDTPVTLPEEAPLLQWMYTQFSKNLALAKQKKTVPNQVQAQWRGQNITFTKETIQDTVYWRSKNPFTATSYKIRYDGKLSVEN